MPTFSKNARYTSSIINRANCGGNKKAGLSPSVGFRNFMLNRARQNNIYSDVNKIEFGNSWNQLIALAGANNEDQSGRSVALSSDGTIVAIGEIGFDINTNFSNGRVRIFQKNGVNWNLFGTGQTNLVGANNFSEFGFSVALSSDGTIVAIGEPGFDGKGRVRIFQKNGENWVSFGTGQTNLVGANANDSCGISVALSSDGTIVAIGEPGFENGNTKGRVRIFKKNGENWVSFGTGQTNLVGENANDLCGISVALSSDGTIVAIGERGFDGNKGRVRIFQKNGENWVPFGTDQTNLEGVNANDLCGNSVALSSDGTIVAVGEPGFENGNSKGRVRIFKKNGVNWNLFGTTQTSLVGENANDDCGTSVALSSDGTIVAIGEPDFENGNRKGRVRIFQKNGENWVLFGVNQDSLVGENASDKSGSSVALSSDGTIVASGEIAFESDAEKGRVRVFEIEKFVSKLKCPPEFTNYRPVLAGVGNMYRFKIY